MRITAGAALVACAVGALALPAAGSAKPGYVVKPKRLHLSIPLPASNGYSARLSTEGHRQVTLTLSKGEVVARYLALGTVSRKGIEADFGDFGRVSLRFRGRSRFQPSLIPGLPLPAPLREHCKGRRSVGEKGVFRGNARFSGERGYTEVQASRLKGSVVRSYRRVCRDSLRAGASKGKAGPESVGILATAKRGGVFRFLLVGEASIAEGRADLSLSVAIGGLKEKVGRVLIDKFSLFFDATDSIEISPVAAKPLTAEVELPKPFEGTASYLEEGKTPPSWSGTIGLRLPGSGLVSLAGPEFQADLCRTSKSDSFLSCLSSIFEASPLAQGSGSHSQPLALARLSSLR